MMERLGQSYTDVADGVAWAYCSRADEGKVLAVLLVMDRACSCAFMDVLDISWLQLLLESLQPFPFMAWCSDTNTKHPQRIPCHDAYSNHVRHESYLICDILVVENRGS
jgi:hypothetical protein